MRKLAVYDREAAVAYANRWWNDYNPAYPKFAVDCTNYISQCLRAGGAPMWGSPNRERGWWIGGGNWSFSWSVSHSLRWYLAGSQRGLRARRVQSAGELEPGDIISYDFEGEGVFNHTTIVTSKRDGVPYVNAHAYNVRDRHWAYKDSYAWRPDATYIFWKINDRFD